MWKVIFTQDTETEGDGTLTATNGEVSHIRRCKTTDTKDVTLFVAEAKELLAQKEEKKQLLTDIGTKVADLLNAE